MVLGGSRDLRKRGRCQPETDFPDFDVMRMDVINIIVSFPGCAYALWLSMHAGRDWLRAYGNLQLYGGYMLHKIQGKKCYTFTNLDCFAGTNAKEGWEISHVQLMWEVIDIGTLSPWVSQQLRSRACR